MGAFERHLLAATGFMELGMFDDAAMEIEDIDPQDKLRPEVFDFRATLFAQAKKWGAMEVVTRRVVALRPDEPEAWVNWAYATRWEASLEAATEILLRAEKKCPRDAAIQFNLGCYACQMGNLEEAKGRVAKAISLDGKFRSRALDDPDLEPLWDEIAKELQADDLQAEDI